MDQTIVGGFEVVSLPEFGIAQSVAKIDTGAYSGALHCSYIKLIKNDPLAPVLEFALFDNPRKVFKTTAFARKMV